MIGFSFLRRLEAVEESVAQLKTVLLAGKEDGQGGEERPPVFKLDDRRMQEGISNLMGYDPAVKGQGEGR